MCVYTSSSSTMLSVYVKFSFSFLIFAFFSDHVVECSHDLDTGSYLYEITGQQAIDSDYNGDSDAENNLTFSSTQPSCSFTGLLEGSSSAGTEANLGSSTDRTCEVTLRVR